MQPIGIVCEYNPFHSGHLHHLSITRERSDGLLICCMSGDFVQRGDYAVFPRHIRAEAAVRCGADLVVELPLPWAVASAPRFAAGAVHILAALGCRTLSFGSETGDAERLSRAAALLTSPEFDDAVRAELSVGTSYAAARAAAAETLGGFGNLLANPNDNLAVEYLRAAAEQGHPMTPLAIRRVGAAHDAARSGDEFPSASALRAEMRQDPALLPDGIPASAAAVFARAKAEGLGPVFSERVTAAHMALLRRLSPTDLAQLPDMGEGFEMRLFSAIRASSSPTEAADTAKTRRYAHSRIRRQLLAAYLGITAKDGTGLPPYVRILAFGERGRAYLAGLGKTEIPLISKPARHGLSGDAARLFEKEALAADLYALALPDPALHGAGGTYRLSPVYVRDVSINKTINT